MKDCSISSANALEILQSWTGNWTVQKRAMTPWLHPTGIHPYIYIYIYIHTYIYIFYIYMYVCIYMCISRVQSRCRRPFLNLSVASPICIGGLVQDCSISSAWALEILQSFTKPSNIYDSIFFITVILDIPWIYIHIHTHTYIYIFRVYPISSKEGMNVTACLCTTSSGVQLLYTQNIQMT